MAWGTVYLLKLDSDAIVTQASDKYASWYSLGPHQKHAINGGGSYTQLMSPESIAQLGKVTSVDKVMILAHGAEGDDFLVINEEAYDGSEAADYFHRAGITKAGLITFKCCGIGKQGFLEEFRKGCANKISVGFLKGYLGDTVTFESWLIWGDELDASNRDASKPYEKVAGASEDIDKLSAQKDRYRTISGADGSEINGRDYRAAWDKSHIQ